MIENPYESPKSHPDATAADASWRRRARHCFHASILILLVPAVYNAWAFDLHVVSPLPSNLAIRCRAVNVVGFMLGSALIWCLGLPALEAASRLLRTTFAGRTDPAPWEEIFHRSFTRLVYLAAPGAVLWMIWVFAFYQVGVGFYEISWAVGVPAHLLGACWYVPLVYRWYRLAKVPAASDAP